MLVLIWPITQSINMNTIEKLQSMLSNALADNAALHRENQELRNTRFVRFNEDECWIYQGDGEDHLESLVCPVVIHADVLDELIQRANANNPTF